MDMLFLKSPLRNALGKMRNRILSKFTGKQLLIAAAVIAAVIIALIFLLHGQSRKDNPSASQSEISRAVERLTAMENQSIADVRAKIDAASALSKASAQDSSIEGTETDAETVSEEGNGSDVVSPENSDESAPAEEPAPEGSFAALFADSVIMGDSIVYDLGVYQFLNPSSVIGENGASLEFLDDAIQTAASLAPRNIFLYYGFNDIGHVGDDYESFRWLYEQLILRLQEAVPGVQIYANLLFTPRDLETLQNAWYSDISPYNEIIAGVCAEHGVTVLDNSDLPISDYYYEDGYHVMYDFYPYWLEAMARGAGWIE